MASHAATDAPMFAGTTLTIHGETFTWTGPATEDASWHYDTYTNATSQSVTVTGMVGYPDLATVNGSSAQGVVAGHLSSGMYADNLQTLSEQGGWQIEGMSFTSHEMTRTRTANLYYGLLEETGEETYSGPNGTYQRTWYSYSDAEGESWNLSGLLTSQSGHASLSLFGSTYLLSESSRDGSSSTDYSHAGWKDKYTSLDGGILELRYLAPYNQNGTTTLTAWDPVAGKVTSYSYAGVPPASLGGVTWKPRAGPSFSRAQLWVNGLLLNWQSGTIAKDGTVVDSYSGGSGTPAISITAQTRNFAQGGDAVVTFAGGATGTLSNAGTFAVPDWNIQNAQPNRSAPLFTGNATVLKVAYSNYSFAGGYQDSLGNRTDVFVNPSLGTLALSGTTASPTVGSVKVSRSGTLYNGTFSDGSFSVSGVQVFKPSSQPNVFGPPAFWVRGVFYTRTADTALTYEATAGHTITLGGSASAPTLAGEDASGTFSGAFARDPVGVFLVQDAQGAASVPVLPANADGTLHLAWEAPPAEFPPATMVVDGRIWVFLGTAVEDTSATTSAAYYGSATASDEGDWLLKLRTDGSGVATCTDYGTAASTTGSYSPQTHLFQTSGPESGFPVPVYGVDPNANDALWGLTQPQDGLPATFIVRDEAWRLAAYDEPTDTFTYQGFYSGQWMTLGAADASGQRLVTLADPVHNHGSTATTQGTLSSERRSVRLRDGTLALSGNEQGAQVAVQHEDDYQLHTIAADLDLVGNNLSFGVLQGDASLAGALFQFADDSATASLHSILSRPQAQWGWWKAEGSDADALRPVMWLGTDHRLNLYKAGAYAAPAIVLDPAGTSSFQGPVRVPQSGDIPMGIYQEGDPP